MLILAVSILFIIYLMGATWIFYLGLMNLRVNRDKLTAPAKVFGYPLLAIGMVLDIACNLVIGTLSFIAPPREFLFTTRCERYLNNGSWRGRVARWYCRHFLDPFDKNGRHCKG